MQLEAAAQIDYEDLAIEDSTPYLVDIGNSGRTRPDLDIYERDLFSHDCRSRVGMPLSIECSDQEVFPAHEWHVQTERLSVMR